MVKKLSFLLILVSLIPSVSAQDWTFVQKQDLFQEITAGDVGALGKVYLGTERGNIYSFEADGTPDTQFSSSVFQPVTHVDASNSLRVFVFYQSSNQFEYLDRFHAQPRVYNLNDYNLIAEHLVQNMDASLYVFSGNKVIHFDPRRASIISETELANLSLDSVQCLVQGNFVQGLTSSSIGQFMNNGSYAEHANVSGGRWIDVVDSQLVVLADGGLLNYNLRTGRLEWVQPPRNDFEKVLKSGSYYHFIRGSSLITYRLDE